MNPTEDATPPPAPAKEAKAGRFHEHPTETVGPASDLPESSSGGQRPPSPESLFDDDSREMAFADEPTPEAEGAASAQENGEAETTLFSVPGRKKAAKPPAPDSPVKLGQYRVVREIGRGGMGVVYEGFQETLDRRVAIKTLPDHLAGNKTLAARFLIEARAAAKFHHPNIAAIYEAGEDEGVQFIAMEFVEGRPLSALLANRDIEDIGEALRIASEAASALDRAHKAGVVHRDIKPSNIMIREEDGAVKIMDFGLARMEGDERLTQTGMTLGTPAYMSPEQAGSKTAGPIDHRSDIFSLGVVAYEMLTLRIPFDGRGKLEILRNIIDEAAAPPSLYRPDIPPALEKILMKALAKKVSERYQTAGEFADDLKEFRRLLDRKTEAAALARASGRPAPKALALIALIALALGLCAGLVLKGFLSPAPVAPPPSDPAVQALGQMREALKNGQEWQAAQAALLALRRGAEGSAAREAHDRLEGLAGDWARRRDSLAGERRHAEAAAFALRALEADPLLEKPGRLAIPAFEGRPGNFAELIPGERLNLWMDAVAEGSPGDAAEFLAWAKGLNASPGSLAHHLFAAALAQRAAEPNPPLSRALFHALAEEAESPAAREFRLADLLDALKSGEVGWTEHSRSLAALRPALDLPPEALAFSEFRSWLREAVRSAEAAPGGWRKASAQELRRLTARLESEGRSAFAGDLFEWRREPSNVPPNRLGREPGAEPVAMETALAAPKHRGKPRFHPLEKADVFGDGSPGDLPELKGLPELWRARLEIGDGPRKLMDALVASDAGRGRWMLLIDTDADGDFADEEAFGSLYPVQAAFALESRFGTRTPLALRFGLAERSGMEALSVESLSIRHGALEGPAGAWKLFLRLQDFDSNGVFDDFAERGARLTWRLAGDASETASEDAPESAALELDRGSGLPASRFSAAASQALEAFAEEMRPDDCLEAPDGTLLRFRSVAPGGGELYFLRNSAAPASGYVYGAEDNQPVPDARLTLRYLNFERELLADANGRISGEVPLGRCSIRAEAPGREPLAFPEVVLTEREAGLFQIPLARARNAP